MGVASPLSGNISDQQQLYDYLVRSVMAAMLCSCFSAAEVAVLGKTVQIVTTLPQITATGSHHAPG